MSTLLLSLARENPWPGLAVASLNLVVALSLVGLSLLLGVTISLLAWLHALVDRAAVPIKRRAQRRRAFHDVSPSPRSRLHHLFGQRLARPVECASTDRVGARAQRGPALPRREAHACPRAISCIRHEPKSREPCAASRRSVLSNACARLSRFSNSRCGDIFCGSAERCSCCYLQPIRCCPRPCQASSSNRILRFRRSGSPPS